MGGVAGRGVATSDAKGEGRQGRCEREEERGEKPLVMKSSIAGDMVGMNDTSDLYLSNGDVALLKRVDEVYVLV